MSRLGTHLLAAAVMAAATVGGLPPVAAQESEPTAALSSTSVAPGKAVDITGEHWEPGEIAYAVICGNGGLDGSADCDLPGSTTNMVWPDGTLHLRLDVEEPPSPCPCIVRVGIAGYSTVVELPLEVQGAPTAPTRSKFSAADRVATLEVVSAEVTGRGPAAAWIGGEPVRRLEVRVRNNGDAAVSDILVSARWGDDGPATNVIPSQTIDALEPGEETTVVAEFELEALAHGEYRVVGTVGGLGNRTTFETTTTTWPWGIVVLVLVLLQIGFLGLRNRARRRLARSQPPLHLAGELPLGPSDDAPSEKVLALVGAAGIVIDLDATEPVVLMSDEVVDLDASEEIELPPAPLPEPDASAQVALASARVLALTPRVSAPVLALRTVQLAAHLRESTRTSLAERDLTPQEVERRLQSSERARRELAESLVLASAYRSDDMLGQHWCVPPPVSSAPAPRALSPARHALSV